MDLNAVHQVTFSRTDCPTKTATFDGKTTIDAGLGATLLYTIYKRLAPEKKLSPLMRELASRLYHPADFLE